MIECPHCNYENNLDYEDDCLYCHTKLNISVVQKPKIHLDNLAEAIEYCENHQDINVGELTATKMDIFVYPSGVEKDVTVLKLDPRKFNPDFFNDGVFGTPTLLYEYNILAVYQTRKDIILIYVKSNRKR